MASNYRDVAVLLEGRLRGLLAGDSAPSDLRAVLEIAALEFGIRHVDSSKRRKAAEGSGGEFNEDPSCSHICNEHAEVKNWGSLPRDLLHLVFAHLPVGDILHLRCLSKEWKRALVTTKGSPFIRVCDEVHPKMVAFIRKLGNNSVPGKVYLLRVFDVKTNSWHALQFSLSTPEASYKYLKIRWRVMISHHGGLVLFYVEAHPKKRGPFRSFFYTVVNPLTQRFFDLPPVLNVVDVFLHRILVVDRETSRYKVLIAVGRHGAREPEEIQVFDSETGRWSQPNEAEHVRFGNQSAEEFAKEQMSADGPIPITDTCVKSFSYLKNRLFVLYDEVDAGAVETNPPKKMHYIKEYVAEEHPQRLPTWLEVGIHRCAPFEQAPKKAGYTFKLHSANGYLMVFAAINERDPYRNDKGWIYDLASKTWRDLPQLPGDPSWVFNDTAIDIRWNVHPGSRVQSSESSSQRNGRLKIVDRRASGGR